MDSREIARVEDLLGRVRTSRVWVRLPDELRAQFRVEHNQRERTRAIVAVLAGVLAFDAFTLSDANLIPDMAGVSAWTRLLVITPLGLLYLPVSWWALRRDPGSRIHHVYGSLVGLCMLAWVCALQILTDAPTGITYFVGAFLIVTFFSSAIRTSFVITAATLVTMGLVFVVAMTQVTVTPAVIRTDASMTMVAFVFFGMLVAHRDEYTNVKLYVAKLHTTVLEARREVRLSQLASLNQQLARDATIDALTGVPNRRALDTAAQAWLYEAAGRRGALIVDLDHFKDYNDNYGHAAGDECLQRVARVMADSVRQVDALLSRYGGEEFVVLLEQVGLAETEAVAERLRGAVANLQIPAPNGSVVTVSIGGAWTAHEEDAEAGKLMAAADEALYAAKASGRNMVVFGARSVAPVAPAAG